MAAKKTTPSTNQPVSKKITEVVISEAKKPAKKATKSVAEQAIVPVASKAAPKKTAAKKAVITKTKTKLTLEEIARAAYLNYRSRVEQGLPGDSRGDWLEAERLLGKPEKS